MLILLFFISFEQQRKENTKPKELLKINIIKEKINHHGNTLARFLE